MEDPNPTTERKSDTVRTKIRANSGVMDRILNIMKDLEHRHIVFICRACGEHFAEKLQTYVEADERDILAPNLCPQCGNYEA